MKSKGLLKVIAVAVAAGGLKGFSDAVVVTHLDYLVPVITAIGALLIKRPWDK